MHKVELFNVFQSHTKTYGKPSLYLSVSEIILVGSYFTVHVLIYISSVYATWTQRFRLKSWSDARIIRDDGTICEHIYVCV